MPQVSSASTLAPPVSKKATKLQMGVAVFFAVFFGMTSSLQSRINGELGHQIGDGFTAAAISFGLGLVILVGTLLVWPAGRRGLGLVRAAISTRSLSWWHVLGGLGGAFYVLSQGLTASVLGVALFTVAIVAGQTISGLAMDRLGVGPGGQRPLTVPRVAGAVVALLAVAWAVSGQISGGVPLWLMAMPLLAGIGQGWQQAVNGRVRVAAESALTATFLNFLFGTIALLIALLVHALLVGLPSSLPTDPWLYTGGVLGCIAIAGTALIVRTTGVLVLALGMVAGQLLSALALDLLAPTSAHPVAFATIGGTALALVAVLIVGVRRRTSRSASV